MVGVVITFAILLLSGALLGSVSGWLATVFSTAFVLMILTALVTYASGD